MADETDGLGGSSPLQVEGDPLADVSEAAAAAGAAPPASGGLDALPDDLRKFAEGKGYTSIEQALSGAKEAEAYARRLEADRTALQDDVIQMGQQLKDLLADEGSPQGQPQGQPGMPQGQPQTPQDQLAYIANLEQSGQVGSELAEQMRMQVMQQMAQVAAQQAVAAQAPQQQGSNVADDLEDLKLSRELGLMRENYGSVYEESRQAFGEWIRRPENAVYANSNNVRHGWHAFIGQQRAQELAQEARSRQAETLSGGQGQAPNRADQQAKAAAAIIGEVDGARKVVDDGLQPMGGLAQPRWPGRVD